MKPLKRTRRADQNNVTRACGALGCLLLGCWFDGDLKHDTGATPESLDDGWQVASPEDVGLASQALAAIHEQLLREDRYRGTLSLLVVKDGKLVWETYLRRRSDQGAVRNIQSVTKSVTSLVFGIARDQGSIPSLDATLGQIFPDELVGLDPRKAAISLRDLLTMRSGIAFHNEDFSVEMWVEKPRQPLHYLLSQPLYADPGERFYYRDVDPQLIGYALSRLTGESEEQLAQALFAPLGIVNYYWEQGGRDGIHMAAHGLQLLPRDLAKIGQLVLERGEWHGQRVVSEEWLALSTAAQLSPEQLQADTRQQQADFGYGYYWWVVPGVGFSAWGHGGQFVLVVPARNLVLVQTAFPDTNLPDSDLQSFLDLVQPLL
ncbi:MAG TPA: serine hydrolase [Polyangiaceae bacterium]|nr:serine hydrolase [Polyangiaceae bacterium]